MFLLLPLKTIFHTKEMVLLKILKSSHFNFLVKQHQNTTPLSRLTSLDNPQTYEHARQSFPPCSTFQRTFSATAQLEFTDVLDEKTKPNSICSENEKKKNNNKKNKPLDVMFKEAVGITEKHEDSDCSEEEFGEVEVLGKLRKLEREVKTLKGNLKEEANEEIPKKERVQINQFQSKSLYSLFAASDPAKVESMFVKKSVGEEKFDASKRQKDNSCAELKPFKGLSQELVSLVRVLHQQGYLKNANFLPPKHLNLSCISNHYSRSFIRSAAERFGEDHKEIAKCLSRDHLTRIALFGCPSTEKRIANAAKRLRSFYDIKEDIVCRPCKLRSSCKVMNHTIGKKVDVLSLKDVMKLLTLYDLDLVPEQLEIPDEIKSSISKLLIEVVNLSEERQHNPASEDLCLDIQVN